MPMHALLPARKRIMSIDIFRGLIMVIMALDHVRDFFHNTATTANPLDPATTTPILYFTRWITHFCAPTFVFLAGASIFLMAQRKTKNEVSAFLFKRGCWLIFVEFFIINFALSFNPSFPLTILTIIWAIGISMVLLSLLIRLPYKLIFLTGLIIVLGHNLMDFPEQGHAGKINLWWDLLHHNARGAYEIFRGHFLVVSYPFLPWTGVMLLGYCFGKLFLPTVDPRARRKTLVQLGSALILFFFLLRFLNVYGDPSPWSHQLNGEQTVFSFFNVTKYPPSLQFLCITIGPGMYALAAIENMRGWFARIFNVFGRVPLFYYILHLYIIHLTCMVIYLASGYHFSDAFSGTMSFRSPGFSLPIVYLIWLGVVIICYPLCKRYDHYKTTHRYWWLSYL